MPRLCAKAPKPCLKLAKGFRCIDLSFTLIEAGEFTVHRMHEWATAASSCDWNPALGLLAPEIDIDNSEVCAAGFCMFGSTPDGNNRQGAAQVSDHERFPESDLTSAPSFGTRHASS